jgi:hypothetical protein
MAFLVPGYLAVVAVFSLVMSVLNFRRARQYFPGSAQATVEYIEGVFFAVTTVIFIALVVVNRP